jgi:hypothetical protein
LGSSRRPQGRTGGRTCWRRRACRRHSTTCSAAAGSPALAGRLRGPSQPDRRADPAGAAGALPARPSARLLASRPNGGRRTAPIDDRPGQGDGNGWRRPIGRLAGRRVDDTAGATGGGAGLRAADQRRAGGRLRRASSAAGCVCHRAAEAARALRADDDPRRAATTGADLRGLLPGVRRSLPPAPGRWLVRRRLRRARASATRGQRRRCDQRAGVRAGGASGSARSRRDIGRTRATALPGQAGRGEWPVGLHLPGCGRACRRATWLTPPGRCGGARHRSSPCRCRQTGLDCASEQPHWCIMVDGVAVARPAKVELRGEGRRRYD